MTSFSGNNYKLEYPKSWSLDTSGKLGADLFVFSPVEDETDKFRENVNVLIQDIHGQNIDLEKYKQITEKQITDMLTDGEIIESSVMKKAAGEYFKIIYAMTQGKFRIKIVSICLIEGDKAYLATFSTELDKYEKYRKFGEQILNSFAVTK
jgi:serine/threonine-protein kinase